MIENLPTQRIFHVRAEELSPWIEVIDPATGLKHPKPKREIMYKDSWFDEGSIKKEFHWLGDLFDDIEFEYLQVRWSEMIITIVAEWY
ncbi:unnamed protein product [marine sediment metagenome]|uniref:Uncharacterized protein n=1 Tax=marine sediment metagenome TaxID=412755 RepID=X0Z356_9ZZZZ